MNACNIETFPKSRLATLDICAIGIRKHRIAAILEIDVSESRKKIARFISDLSKNIEKGKGL
jgi:hypothetical protein